MMANTPSPRIIKLHGTVPAHIPFIFTEEDYRTYPKKFAPFVNTVQQIMMNSSTSIRLLKMIPLLTMVWMG
ncbi:SIR2 family protein [Acinetobacter baumannii]|uniref:SIR2 family protein n=1 Tax=Acinetobacter baumannii TaxID=470 RepID=UPI0038CDA008